jgi:uncharacterized protein DUF4124
MNNFKIACVLLCMIFTSTSVMAQMYKWVDAEGNISYSDQPPYKGAEKLDVPELTTIAPTRIPEKKETPDKDKEEEEAVKSYSFLKITSPENNATILDDAGTLSIGIAIKPALSSTDGHYLSVSLDGKIVQDKLAGTTASLTNIDRGTHNISVSVKNKAGKVMRQSKPITVHLRRQYVLPRKAPR